MHVNENLIEKENMETWKWTGYEESRQYTKWNKIIWGANPSISDVGFDFDCKIVHCIRNWKISIHE